MIAELEPHFTFEARVWPSELWTWSPAQIRRHLDWWQRATGEH